MSDSEQHHEERRDNENDNLHAIFSLIKDMRGQMTDHIRETQDYRKNNDRLIEAHKSAIRENGDSIVCMKDHFLLFEKRFDDEYKPMLQVFISERTEDLARRKWWTAIYDEQKKRSVLIATGFIGVALFVGAGAAVLYLIKQINGFLSQALSGLFS